MNKVLAAVIAATFVGPAAHAAPVDLTRQSEGYTYFSRPAADMVALHRELRTCLTVIVPFAREAPTSFGPVGGAAGSILSGGIRGSMDAAALENCMVVRGWRVVRLPDEEGAALSHLNRPRLADRLRGWVGAEAPHGTVIRRWGNDAAKSDTIRTSMPGLSYRPSLSLLSAPEPAGDLPPPLPAGAPRDNKGIIFRAAKPAELASIPADSALLVITLRNSDQRSSSLLRLQRLGPDSQTPVWLVDKKPYALNLAVPKRTKGSGPLVGQTTAYVVPAGRWALAGISDLLTLCMGAPFFEVRPGDVIHTGAIDFGSEGLPIDPDTTPASAHLADAPSLQRQIRPASWRNGATFPCGGYQYALEYPDLPFEPTYVRAGMPAAP